MKFYSSHGNLKPKLKKYFHMYRSQLHFALFCATNTLGIYWKYLNHPNLPMHSVCILHLFFHVRILLHGSGISLSHEYHFSKIKHSYTESLHYIVCDDYVVNADETCMHGDWFLFALVMKKRSPPENLT